MTAPERIWTASTNGKCHVGFDAPSLNYTNEYVRADLSAVQPAHGVWNKCTFDLSGAGYDCALKDGYARHGAYGEGQKVFWDGTTINADGLYILSKPALDKRIAAAQPAQVHPDPRADLAAVQPDPNAGAVKVKPLVWDDDGYGNFRAQSIRGGEGVDRLTEPRVIGDDLVNYEAWGIRDAFDSPEAAQAAVEVEIASEIMAAIDVQPDPRDEVIARLVEALSMAQLWLDYAGAYDMQGINAALAAAKAVMK